VSPDANVDSRDIVCSCAFADICITNNECFDAAVHHAPRALWPVIAALTLLFSGEVLGQVYPTRPIHVVPFAGGAGVTDIMARLAGAI
jgi:hypothetical protein